MIYNYPRQTGKVYNLVLSACIKSLYTGKQLIVVPNKKSKERYTKLILQIMGGAWPIHLKIKTVDELYYNDALKE